MRGFSYSKAYSAYGSSMGRPTYPPHGDPQRLRLERVPLSGDYDPGGAYWGGGVPLFVAYDDETQLFVRASSRLDAARKLHAEHPNLRFRGFKP